MNILKLLGLQEKTTTGPLSSNNEAKPSNSEDLLHLWEDDYLMLELLHEDNLGFIRSETKRIDSFSKDHFEGTGFTNIAVVGKNSISTIKKLIKICDVEDILVKCGLEKLEKVYMQPTGLAVETKVPIAFGTTNFAFVCDAQGLLLENIWLTGRLDNEKDKQKFIDALFCFGKTYRFVAVNWYQCTHQILDERDNAERFINDLIVECE